MQAVRVGYGEDAHALEEGRALVLGGVNVPSRLGPRAHSDGDVLLHALADALLSAFALGDIGDRFPPGDARFRNMQGPELLRLVLEEVREAADELALVNVAAVVTLDAPRLGSHREAIRDRVAAELGIAPQRVGIGFKTSEGLAPQHVQARVTVLFGAPGPRAAPEPA